MTRRGLSAASRRSVLMRSAIAVLLIAAAIGPEIPAGEGALSVMFVLDQSDSLTVRQRAALPAAVERYTQHMRSDDRFGIVTFGVDAAVAQPLARRAPVGNLSARVAGGGSDVARALRAARLALPDSGGRRIVLLSDGRDTSGRADREADISAASGIPIDVVPVADASGFDPTPARVVSVEAPAEVREAESFGVTVLARGRAGSRIRIGLLRNDQPVGSADIRFGSDGTGSAAFSEQRDHAGTVTYRATVHTDDGLESPEPSAGAIVSVAGTPSVLYVGDAPGPLSRMLSAAGIRVSIVGPQAVPASLAGLEPHDAVILDDVTPDSLREAQVKSLARHVDERGAGLLVLGSPRSLAADGYPLGPLGDVLPVDVRARRGQRSADVAFVLVFDKSGSMADRPDGVMKIELARQSVMRVLTSLASSDRFGAIAFDAAPTVVLPLGTERDPASVERRLRQIEPGGSTSIGPAVELAVKWLASVSASRRHILLVTDGRTSAADEDRARKGVAGQTVEVSVVGIGADADRGLLTRLAAETGGRSYFPSDVGELPRIAAREATRASAGRTVEEPFQARLALDHPIAAGLDDVTPPSIGGYVVSVSKPGAVSILSSPLGDPVLGAWRFGVGRAAVFTSDWAGPWSANLRAWPRAGALWIQTIRWLARAGGNDRLRVTLRAEAQAIRVMVDAHAPDGALINYDEAAAMVLGPDGVRSPVSLVASAPGRLEGRIATDASGPYVVTVDASDSRTRVNAHAASGIFWSAPVERAGDGTDVEGLLRLARLSGGRLLRAEESPFDPARPAHRVPVWPALLWAALGLLIVDLVLRGRRRGAAA